jgi:hypothetical protein
MLTGHSLGGAMATIAAYELALAGYPLTHLINFGSPRVGNALFARAMSALAVNGSSGAHPLWSAPDMQSTVQKLLRAGGQGPTGSDVLWSPILLRAVAKVIGTAVQKRGGKATPEEQAVLLACEKGIVSALNVASHGEPFVDHKKAPSNRDASFSVHGAGIINPFLALENANIDISSLVDFRIRLKPASFVPSGSVFRGSVNAKNLQSHNTGFALYRIINNADLVPHFPPEMLGYRHSVTEVWYKKNGYSICNSQNGEDSACSDSLMLPTSVADHRLYLDYLISTSC